MIKKFVKFIIKLISKNWTFKKYSKKKILILDKAINLNFDDNSVCQFPKNELNFLIVIELIVKKILFIKNLKNLNLIDSYNKIFIEKIDPDIMIGHECDLISFKSKVFFPKKILILFQFAAYSSTYKSAARKRHLGHMGQTEGKIKVDYFCVYDEWHKSFFDYFDTNFLITGSIKNNTLPKKILNKKYDIMIISEFRGKVKSYHGTNNNVSTMRLSDVCISYISKIVSEFCKEKNKKLVVGLVSNRKDKSYKGKDFRKNEIEFFRRDISNFVEENKTSIDLSEETDLNICLASNLGPELLSREKKVLFLNIHHFVLPWYFLPNKSGPFWYQGQDKEIIKSKIEFLLSINNEEWKKILRENKIAFKFDEGNKLLKDKIRSIIESEK